MLLAPVVVIGAPAVVADEAVDKPAPPKTAWTRWADTGLEVECASIKVPLDWSRRGGEMIDIGLARRKATNQAARIGSAVMISGGPGTSGVSQVKAGNVFSQAVLDRFDVVGFDARGIGSSTQVRCDEELINKTDAALKVASRSQADFDALRQANKELSEDCRERTGPLYDQMNARNIARDLDVIRVALGEQKLTTVGYSYGTLIGQMYAEMFPRNIRAMVNDANVDHNTKNTWEFLESRVAAMEENFVLWADWCDKTPDCALYGRDARKIYGELRERARSGDLVDPDTGSRIDFNGLTSQAFGVNFPNTWKMLATTFKNWHDGIATPAPSAGRSEQAVPDRANFVRQAMWCQDSKYRRVGSYAELTSNLVRMSKKYPNIQWNQDIVAAMDCVGYVGRTTNPEQPVKVKGAPSLVMVGNLHDAMTPYSFSLSAARQTKSTLVTYEGFGHAIYPSTAVFGPSKCINDVVDNYLIDLEVPAKGISCPAIEVPGGGTQPQPG